GPDFIEAARGKALPALLNVAKAFVPPSFESCGPKANFPFKVAPTRKNGNHPCEKKAARPGKWASRFGGGRRGNGKIYLQGG
ncbi:MAG: hypothetical protein ACLFRG_08430, partial [Desulfococcaceae bacterium]